MGLNYRASNARTRRAASHPPLHPRAGCAHRGRRAARSQRGRGAASRRSDSDASARNLSIQGPAPLPADARRARLEGALLHYYALSNETRLKRGWSAVRLAFRLRRVMLPRARGGGERTEGQGGGGGWRLSQASCMLPYCLGRGVVLAKAMCVGQTRTCATGGGPHLASAPGIARRHAADGHGDVLRCARGACVVAGYDPPGER